MNMKLNPNSHPISRAILAAVVVMIASCTAETPAPPEPAVESEPHVMASTSVEAGRYLVIVGGCNDCHTDGYMATGGQIPETDWLAGTVVGFRGPWGTTYPINLRLRAQEMTEDDWVDVLHFRTDLPPMPWMNINQISDADARALYQYIRSLGPKGEHVPAAIPPTMEPTTPFISLEPQNMEAMAAE